MNTKNLRIGNWVCAEGNHWGTVKALGDTVFIHHALVTGKYYPEQLYPIAVTLDMLPLCGFHIFGDGYRHKESYHFLKFFEEGDLIFDIAGEAEEFSYIHQLQNIYFDLTGKLLEPNLYGN